MDITYFNNLHKNNEMICIYKCVIHYSVQQGYKSSATATGARAVSSHTEGTQYELCPIHQSGVG